MRTIGEASNGETLDMALGEVIEIRLPENPTTGFRWTPVSPGKPVCEVLYDDYHPPARSIPGAAGEHVWRVRGAERGSGDIEFQYRRSFEPAPSGRRFTLHLRVG